LIGLGLGLDLDLDLGLQQMVRAFAIERWGSVENIERTRQERNRSSMSANGAIEGIYFGGVVTMRIVLAAVAAVGLIANYTTCCYLFVVMFQSYCCCYGVCGRVRHNGCGCL
jgi:hypothetical protein